MIAFEWNKHFITGLDKVDSQHKHLVEIVNRLGTMVIENIIDEDILRTILVELVEYTKYHFTEEQQIMSNSNLDNRHILKHIKVHQKFIKEIVSMASEHVEITSNSTRELFDYLMHWLAYHILGMDQEMARQIEYIKIGKNPSDAYTIVTQSQSDIAAPLLTALEGLFSQVSQKNIKLHILNDSLEKKVKERTKKLEELNKSLEDISFTDQLTGIKNRRFAIETLVEIWEQTVTEDINLSCLMIDADNFKFINDNYGHDAGDIVLKELAITLKKCTKSPSFVSRLGGDEFIVICPGMALENAIDLADTIVKNVSKLRIKTGDGFWKSSVSIGVSSRSNNIKDYEDLIKAADINVYEAKRAGKNCFRY